METRYLLLAISLWLIGFSIQNETATEDQNVVILGGDWEAEEEDWEGEEEGDDESFLPFYPEIDGRNETESNVTMINSTDTTVETIPPPTKVPPKKSTRDSLQCPALPMSRLENGRIRMLPNERIRYICNRGYRLLGPSLIRCFKGQWTSAIQPRCSLPYSSCEPPEPISHGMVFGENWSDGSVIMYACDLGYILIGHSERTCESGYWSSHAPVCRAETEPLKDVATRLKEQFIDEAGSHSSDSDRGRALGRYVEHTGLELMLLIDQSGSIDPVDFKYGIDFAKFLVEEFGVRNGPNDDSTGTRLGVVMFADDARFAIKLDDASIRTKEDAKMRLDGLKPEGGGTAIQRALIEVMLIVGSMREKAKKAIFLMTDGQNNVGNQPPSDVAKDLKKNGVEIFTVGIGRDVNRDELTSIASEPARNHVFLLHRFSDLADIMSLIRETPTPAPPIGPEKCGYLPKRKGKGFHEAVPGWPWLATIYVKHPPRKDSEDYRLGICSGSLICSQWVLTSGSCFYGEFWPNKDTKFINAYVTLGEDDLSRYEKTETNFRIAKVVFHPKFSLWRGSDYDFALVKLKKHAPLELIYRPICLPTAELLFQLQFDNGIRGTMAGWGTVPSDAFFKGNFASSFKILPEVVQMPFVKDFTCEKIIPRKANYVFCAGSVIRRTCSGNLGSPIIVKDPSSNIHYIIGVLTSKKYCNSDYNMFTYVSQHLSWISNVTKSCEKAHEF